jgi:hypothetical protein
LDGSYRDEPWADLVAGVLPAGAKQTSELGPVTAFCGPQA